MKSLLYLLSFVCLMNSGKLHAQNNLVVYTEPKVAPDMQTDASEAKIIIFSPNKDVKLTHEMGHEKGVIVGREKNGEYRYELTHPFNEDEKEAGFAKTIVKISNTQGGKSSSLTMKAGMCYVGRFEIPLKFSYMDESTVPSAYAESNRAKVSFVSEINDLSIHFNGKEVVSNGKQIPSLPYLTVNIQEKDNLTSYDLIFDTSAPETKEESVKSPVFTVKSSFPEELKIQLREGSQLTAKGLFRFRILLQLVETVIKEKEKFVSNYAQILANAKQSEQNLKYTTAKGFYQQALAVDDTPKEMQETLEKKIAEMEECENYDNQAKRAMLYIRELKKEGQNAKMEEIEEAFKQALKCYTNLNRLNSSPVYTDLISKTNKALEAFNIIVVEGSVRDKKDNTKLIPNVSIYGVSPTIFTEDMEKKARGVKLGTVDATGKFRVEVDKNAVYGGLLFVPEGNDDYKKNGFVSLKDQKHLKTTIYLYK